MRQALRPGSIFYQTLEAQPDQNRMLLRLRDATKLDAAVAAIRPLIAAEGPTGTPEFELASSPDGTIVLTLSPVALNARARGAVQQSIEIVRRRIDETGVVDPQITQQGDTPHRGAVARHQRSQPDQGAAGQDRAHDVPAGR